jgi:hypothetical protein
MNVWCVNSLFLFLTERGSVAPSNAIILIVLAQAKMHCVDVVQHALTNLRFISDI